MRKRLALSNFFPSVSLSDRVHIFPPCCVLQLSSIPLRSHRARKLTFAPTHLLSFHLIPFPSFTLRYTTVTARTSSYQSFSYIPDTHKCTWMMATKFNHALLLAKAGNSLFFPPQVFPNSLLLTLMLPADVCIGHGFDNEGDCGPIMMLIVRTTSTSCLEGESNPEHDQTQLRLTMPSRHPLFEIGIPMKEKGLLFIDDLVA